MRNLIAYGLLFAFLLFAGVCYGLDSQKRLNHYVHSSYLLSDGLPNNSVETIVQGPKGYLWIGTPNGLARFDGHKFKIFNKGNTPSIKNNHIKALYFSKSGDLWIGQLTSGAIRYRNGVFTLFSVKDGLPDGKIVDFAEDSLGQIWIGTESGGICAFNGQDVTVFDTQKGLSSNMVYDIHVDAADRVWIGTEAGLDVLSPKQGKVTTYTAADGLPHNRVTELYQSPSGTLWVGTSKGLCQIDSGQILPFEPEMNHPVEDLIEDKDGNLWIATPQNGVIVKKGNTLESFAPKTVLADRDVKSLLEDSEGNVWVGTLHNGLHFLKDGPIVTYTALDGLVDDITLGVNQIDNGDIFISSTQGVSRFRNGQFEKIELPGEVSTKMVFFVSQVQSGALWLGTFQNGLMKYANGEVTVFSAENGLPETRMRGFYQDSKQQIWIGTAGSGAYRYVDGQFKNYSEKDGLPSNRVAVIREDPAGRIWLGTRSGLAYIEDDKITTADKGLDKPLEYIMALHVDTDGVVWVGTSGSGLYVYRDGVFKQIDTSAGLNDEVIYAIVDDQQGHFWLSTNMGIDRVAKKTLLDFVDGKISRITLKHFGIDDGMKNIEGNGGYQNAGIVAADGKIWIATAGGVSVIDPLKLDIQRIYPKLIFEKAMVDGLPFETNATLPPRTERLEFNYTGISFGRSKNVRFQYQLEGFDQNWVNAGVQKTAVYTNLPPGEYGFRLRVTDGDDIWTESAQKYRFVLTPSFEQTPWFWVLVLLIVLAVVGVVVFVRGKRLEERQQKLSEMAWEQTKDVLNGQVAAIKHVADDTVAISSNMGVLSKTLNTVSSSLKSAVLETAHAVQELERTGLESFENAEKIATSSAQTSLVANQGLDVVNETKSVMHQAQTNALEIVHKSTSLFNRLEEMDTIINAVDSIATQLSVLAVNASIEAAAAGEHGRGFAVVAQEVRSLSKESQNSTETISGLLSHVYQAIMAIVESARVTQENMVRGIESIEQSGAIVQDLNDALHHNTAQARTIKSAIDEQQKELLLIVAEIKKITNRASENKSVTFKIDEEIERLNNLVTQQTTLMDNFETPDLLLHHRSSAKVRKK